jgi:hypothetical protein
MGIAAIFGHAALEIKGVTMKAMKGHEDGKAGEAAT